MSEKENKKCPACNVNLEAKAEGYAMGSVFAHERIHTDIYVCPQCRRIYLFESESDKMVKCPVCGNMHHKGEKCLFCALNKISGANEAS